MKNLMIYTAILCTLFVACNAQNAAEDNSNKPEIKKKVTKRDHSINRSNSYSTLFFDSTELENFIKSKNLNDSVIRRLRSFYNARNYQFAWFSGDGLTEQARGFWNLHDYVTTYDRDTSLRDKALQKKMDRLIQAETLSVSASDKSMLQTELTLTQHFIQYILNNYEKGYVKRKEMERFIPRKKEDALYLADSLLTKKHKDDKYFEDVHEPYGALKEQLGKYYAIAQQGGWPIISGAPKSLKKGVTSPLVLQIKRRLQLTGDLVGTDTSQVFNDTLELAVKNFQSRHGFNPDGVIGTATLKEMNVPVQKRIQQILMNMERMRWIPTDTVGNMIMVNIPEFVLHVYENGKRVIDMPVVVGKEGHNTMMFNGNLKHIVFSPYWNVPRSIVEKEILPAMEKDPGYLASQNMEIVKEEDGLPVIRQLPGPGNSLGKVKFLFPNSFDIYFHDTPAKSLFEKDKRAYSHGCIRLQDPFGMAKYLLRHQPEWTDERILEAMNSGTEKWVNLEKPVPVVITYYTAWVDENGMMNFRSDIYGHDKKLAAKMFTSAL